MNTSETSNLLRQLSALVRAGYSENEDHLKPLDGVTEQHQIVHQIEALIKKIGALLITSPNSLERHEALSFLTLQAEYHSQNGRHTMALQDLEPAATQCFDSLRVDTDRSDPKLLRQQIWVVMYFIYLKYAVQEKKPKVALHHLELVHDAIRNRLQHIPSNYQPYGTLAQFHYLSAICHRLERDFDKAERHFLEAQQAALSRCEQKLDGAAGPESRNTILEETFRNVFCAQILTGLSLLGIKQGRLERACHQLYVAQTLLTGTHQYAWKLFVRSLRVLAERRFAGIGTEACDQAIAKLVECLKDFQKLNDPSGQARCAAELVRAYLDQAEYGPKDKKTASLAAAETYLAWLEKVSSNNRRRARFHALRLNFLKTGSLAGIPDDEIFAVRQSTSRGEPLMEVMLFQSKRITFVDAYTTIESTLNRLQLQHRSDPLLQAECYLALGKLLLSDTDRIEEARSWLSRWQSMKYFVENSYLHAEAKQIDEQTKTSYIPPEYRIFDFVEGRKIPVRKIKDVLTNLEKELIQSAINEGYAKSLNQLNEIYGGTNRFQMKRRLEELELPLPSSRRPKTRARRKT